MGRQLHHPHAAHPDGVGMAVVVNVLDLFSGIGGFSLGLERSGMTTVAFCECEDYPRKVLAKHWPNVPIYDDVRTLTKEQLDADGITGIDVICGGFPCQDLSVAGKQAGINAARSGLWSEFARLIGDIRPRFAIVENVPALLSGDRGRWFGRVLGDLAEIGYDAEWHCIPASAVGAPHRRDRIWIIANPADNGPQNKQRAAIIGKQEISAAWRDRGDIPDSNDAGLEGGLFGSLASEEVSVAVAGCREDVADTAGIRQQGPGGSVERCNQETNGEGQTNNALAIGVSRQWSLEPDVGRVAHGVPPRVDRLKALGNAVVPQVVELIGRAIMKGEQE